MFKTAMILILMSPFFALGIGSICAAICPRRPIHFQEQPHERRGDGAAA